MNPFTSTLIKVAIITLVLALQQLDLGYAKKTGSHICDYTTASCTEQIEFLN
ncbi:hypothetical protein [Acinetobacter rudis]|uniref:Uncharacterized protein n=1 Tax=Acinetobacter rudis TaxID=632955 RepID=A0AAW8JB31_9GAMM|nr:hypothetical protein [Acinetobacter rudis]MDQ8936356.1 hypothetical protein [Acinetobacter rudis]MDQ9018617.1 hypothetical protein [Acinetobacter rudis]